jgi:hypothetical protein
MEEDAESGESEEDVGGKVTANFQKSFLPKGKAGEPTVLARGIVLRRLKTGAKEPPKPKSEESSELLSVTN